MLCQTNAQAAGSRCVEISNGFYMSVALFLGFEAVVAGQPLGQALGLVVEVHDLNAVLVLGVHCVAMEERSQMDGQRDVEAQD